MSQDWHCAVATPAKRHATPRIDFHFFIGLIVGLQLLLTRNDLIKFLRIARTVHIAAVVVPNLDRRRQRDVGDRRPAVGRAQIRRGLNGVIVAHRSLDDDARK